MKDFHYSVDQLDQRATGTIDVTDFDLLDLRAATGTIQIVDYTALSGVTVNVNGTDLVEGVDWTAATSNDATATSLATAIDLISGVGASATTDTVTVTASVAGTAGNSIVMTTTDAVNTVLSGATLSGGQAAGTFTIGSDTITEGTDFNAETDDDTTATNIATAIDGLTGVNASATGSVVTIFADAPGTAGNAKALTTNTAAASTLSGATLLGGVAETFTDVFDYSSVDNVTNVETTRVIDNIAGTTPTVDITPQFSYDKVDWFDSSTVFTQATADGNETKELNTTAMYMRFKIEIGGTNPLADVDIHAVAK